MRAYLQSLAGVYRNAQGATAERGFRRLGVERVDFLDEEGLEDIRRDDVLVASRSMSERYLASLGVLPNEIDYPKELAPFLGRRVWRCDRSELTASDLPLFVRPAGGRAFSSVVALEPRDLDDCGVAGSLWASEVVWFASSWRCFVLRGQVLATTVFEGDPATRPDQEFIARAVAAWQDAPAGYALDFGVTEDGHTMLIRARDGWCLGPCGLGDEQYARLLAARWMELTGCQDPLA